MLMIMSPENSSVAPYVEQDLLSVLSRRVKCLPETGRSKTALDTNIHSRVNRSTLLPVNSGASGG